ncbi:hypothetical protein QYF36_001913 [Acer negundo]|nr:hypothetical protein QYF36_001913 [Acer negundo]
MVTEKSPENTLKKEMSPYGPWLLVSYGGANMMENKGGRASEDRIGKNKGVKTTTAVMGKRSRFDILSEDVEVMVADDINPSKSKDVAGKS